MRKGIPSRVIDILETDGCPMTIDQLRAEYELRFGDVNPDSFRRGVQRLVATGALDAVGEVWLDYDSGLHDRPEPRIPHHTRVGYRETHRSVLHLVNA